jgi:hypothetical protein
LKSFNKESLLPGFALALFNPQDIGDPARFVILAAMKFIDRVVQDVVN